MDAVASVLARLALSSSRSGDGALAVENTSVVDSEVVATLGVRRMPACVVVVVVVVLVWASGGGAAAAGATADGAAAEGAAEVVGCARGYAGGRARIGGGPVDEDEDEDCGCRGASVGGTFLGADIDEMINVI